MTIPAIIVVLLVLFSTPKKQQSAIGIILPLSGEHSHRANSYLNGILLAIKHANNILIKNKNLISVEIRDTENDLVKTAEITRDLIYLQNVKAIIGGFNPCDTRIIQNISEQAMVPFVTGICTHFELTNGNFKFTFRNVTDDTHQFEVLADYISKKHNIKNSVIICDETLYGLDGANKYEEIATKYGQKVLSSFPSINGNLNNRELLENVFKLRADALILLASAKDAALITRQAREAHYSGLIVGPSLLSSIDYRNYAGLLSEGVITTIPFDSNAGGQRSEYFTNEYFKQYKESPDADAAMGYESMIVLALALQKEKTTPLEIQDFLSKLHGWQSISGSGGFNNNGNQLRTAEVAIIKNKKLIPINMESLF